MQHRFIAHKFRARYGAQCASCFAIIEMGKPQSSTRTTIHHLLPQNPRTTEVQTPNDYLRALLLERAREMDLADSAIARAHNRAHENSTLAPSTIQRFRESAPAEGTAPSILMQEAYAAATKTTIADNWREAIRRWEADRQA